MHLRITLSILLLNCANLSAQNIFTALHLNQNTEYKYGKPSQITEKKIFFSSSGKKVEKAIKKYVKSGMLVSEERFDEQGKLVEKLTYKNDTPEIFMVRKRQNINMTEILQ
jgi:antitoxin component YwqK of YwqJK toxin-antitoxin module